MTEELHLDLSCVGMDPQQKLPTEKEWKKIIYDLGRRIVSLGSKPEEIGRDECKLILLNKVAWHNAITKEKQDVFNMPIFALRNDGGRPHAIISITHETWDLDECCWINRKTWTFADHYAHINLSRSTDTIKINTEYDYEQHKWLDMYQIVVQSVCTPITQHNFYDRKLFPNKLCSLYKAQLQGQNTGSSYQTVTSIRNAWVEEAIRDNNSQLIPAQAPHLQLLTKKSLDYLRNNIGEIRQLLNNIPLPKNNEEIMVKLKNENVYRCARLDYMKSYKENGKLSSYYEPITYEDIQNITSNLPKQPIDVICCGLGSAGSGILDQLSRSTYVNSYLLIDPDIIEEKNLRNQWYTNTMIGYGKVSGSKDKLLLNKSRDRQLTIYQKQCKFQDVPLNQYICKYLISGFDSIKARLELLELVENGTMETQYLIDTRYDDLTASIFFIDVSDEGQMRRYRKSLEADYEAFKIRDAEYKKQTNIQNDEQFFAWLEAQNCYTDSCLECLKAVGHITDEEIRNGDEKTECELYTDILNTPCGGEACKAKWKALYEEYKEHIADTIKRSDIQQQESSCIRQNFIDIYKYASTFVFAAIREIESGGDKPFTHVEAQTDKFPTHMIVGK